MGFSEKPAAWTGREPTLDEEIGALDEEDVFDDVQTFIADLKKV